MRKRTLDKRNQSSAIFRSPIRRSQDQQKNDLAVLGVRLIFKMINGALHFYEYAVESQNHIHTGYAYTRSAGDEERRSSTIVYWRRVQDDSGEDGKRCNRRSGSREAVRIRRKVEENISSRRQKKSLG